jgi:hypothetical protein
MDAIACPKCGRPSWNAALHPGQPCLPCKGTGLPALDDLPEVRDWQQTRVDFHGEKATEVTVTLTDGRTVTCTYTTEDKSAFGGVQFSSRKDIGALTIAKVRSVLAGTADLT